MSIFAWIVFGALAGWVANLLVGGHQRRRLGCLLSVVVGVLGAALGGFVYRLATGQTRSFEFDFPSFGVAVLGAVLLLGFVRLVSGSNRHTPRRRDDW